MDLGPALGDSNAIVEKFRGNLKWFSILTPEQRLTTYCPWPKSCWSSVFVNKVLLVTFVLQWQSSIVVKDIL